MKMLSDAWKAAARDYLYLLNRDYPQKAILKIIGDRYRLSGTERSMLYRGISDSTSAAARKEKIFKGDPAGIPMLHIDAYNQLITIGSYLNGNIVFLSNDGILRDAAEAHGKMLRKKLLERSLELVLDFLQQYSPLESIFYLDRPVSRSGEHAGLIRDELEKKDLKGDARLFHSADYPLKRISEGLVASSDTQIIGNTPAQVIDLARRVLEFHFAPEFIEFNEMINDQPGLG